MCGQEASRVGSSSSGSKSGFSLGGSVLKIFVLTCKQKRFGVYFDNKDEIYIFLKTNKLFVKFGGHHMDADHGADFRIDRLYQNSFVCGHIIHKFTESGPFGLFAL